MEDFVFQAVKFTHSATSYTSGMAGNLRSSLAPLREYANSQPDLMNIALLLLIVYLSLSILGMASRWIYGVLVTTIRLLFILFVVAAGAWIWQRGGAAKGDLERLVEMVGKASSGMGAASSGAASSGMGGGHGRGGNDWTDHKYTEY